MKYVVALIMLFTILASVAEAKTAKLRVDREAIETCQFTGKNRCILVTDRPVLVLFQVGERIKMEDLASDSEVRGVFVFVAEHYFNATRQLDPNPIANQPNDYRCRPRAVREGLCFSSGGAKDVLIIVPTGISYTVVTLMFNGRVPAVFVIPKGDGNSVSKY